jgi:hypothetical protein
MKRARKGTLSKLSRSVVCKDSRFDIAIFADGKGRWELEVVGWKRRSRPRRRMRIAHT